MILLIGGSGQLGTALQDVWTGRALEAPARAELDFLDPAALAAALDRVAPTCVVNCSAFHNVEQCEQTPALAFAANALAVDAAAQACARRDIVFATISTDYVFDGTAGRAYDETDAPNPLSAYGASKLAGELLVRRHGPRHLIIRTAGVFGTAGTSNKGYTFIERILQQAERGEALRIVDNMTFSPSYAPHIARVIADLVDGACYGTHHVTGGGATTWYAFAKAALDGARIAADLTAIQYDTFGSGTKRPLYSALRSVTLGPAGIEAAPPWEAGVAAFLAARARRLART
uniref:dTDP-4-dehydrorhamnose reductase n=1 Tax=uncultured organism TaxID=155900 RepID=A0A7L9QC67_9ZZZZ|nr:dTDP-4-dehydrorhamnose reductase [uncultured organism]